VNGRRSDYACPATVEARTRRRFHDAARTVEHAVAKFRRHFDDERELRAEAWVATLTAFRTWDPARADFRAYASRATFMALAKYTSRTKSPVSCPDSAGRRVRVVDPDTGREEMRIVGGRHGSGERPRCVDADTAPLVAEPTSARLAWRARLETRLAEILAGDEQDEAAFELLLEGKKRHSAEVSARIERLRRRLRADAQLSAIWRARE
jgi:hypothetical protein